MTSRSGFFASRNPQAVLKHGVLTRYAYYFAGRAGKATGGKVAFIDGYAGAGRYDDQSPGSPLLLASSAERAKPINRTVRLAFVEPSAKNRTKLIQSLEDEGVDADIIDARPFGDAAADLLDHYQGHAVFAFLDPFGLGASEQVLIDLLRRSGRRQPIDVLYHFSLSSVARMGSAGVSADPVIAKNNADQLDTALGSVDWRTAFTETPDCEGAATETAIQVAHRFGDHIAHKTGVRWTAVEVRQRPKQLPKYLLMLFSGDPTGEAHWEFAGNAAKAHADWLFHCDTADFNANVDAIEQSGVLSLFEVEKAPTIEEIEKSLDAEAHRYLIRHLPQLLSQRRSICPVDDVHATFGQMLGRAGPPAVRRVIKEMHAASLIDDDGKGDFHLRLITWHGSTGS
jgi:three-Cys-motif partner protein